MTPALKQGALAFLFGALGALGQAPFNLTIVMFAALCGAVWLWSRAPSAWSAAWVGWTFGTGYFGVALHWIVSPFMVDAARHGWMAPFALVFLAAGLALLWGLAFWLARRLSARVWALILCWSAMELLRGYIFTGFPWAMPAQVTVDVMAGQGLAWVGPYALNLILIAGAAALIAPRRIGPLSQNAQRFLALPLVAALLLPPLLAPKVAPLTTHTLRLIQPNAPQHEKWDPEKVYQFYERQLALTAGPADTPLSAVIWPETAIPWSLDLAGSALAEIAAAAKGAPVVMGVQRRSDTRYFNSLVVLDRAGEVIQLYDKHHLVPFGEYVPFGDLLGQVGIRGLAAREGNGYSAGPGAQLLELGPLGRALPLICYEAVFSHDVNGAPERPDWLVHVTNDAWFGPAAGPLQHLAQARMRAIEQGLPMARSANTGVSAMIDPWGRVTASLPMGQAGALDVTLPLPRKPTLYSRTGDLPFALLLFAALIGAVVLRRRRLAH